MENKKKLFGILTCSNNYDQNLKLNIEIYKKIFKTYENFCILNLSNLRIFHKKDKTKEKKKFFFSKKIKVFKPKNLKDLKLIFKDKTFIAFNNLGKTFSFFKIYLFLNFIDLKQILLMNIGYPNNKIKLNTNSFSSFMNSFIFFFKKKISYYIFRLLTILRIFPKIEMYFESSIELIKAVNNGVSRKFEKLFPFTKLSYFRNVYKINSRSFNLKNNTSTSDRYICFVDSNFEHLDRIYREGKIDFKLKKKYYIYLKSLLSYLSKIFKKKIVICLHPKNTDKFIYKTFKNFKIIKYKTTDIIKDSFIVLFHESSSIMDAVILDKKIICIKSNLLGNYLNSRANLYKNLLGLYSIELNESYNKKKKEILKNLNKSKKKTRSYINKNLQIDKTQLGEDRIIKVINQKYF